MISNIIPDPNLPVFTVAQLASYLGEAIDMDPVLCDLWVTGEVSDPRYYNKSGHTYFTIKDPSSTLRSVMFKGAKGMDLINDGSQVNLHGKVSFYPRRGDVQFICDIAMQLGTGPLHRELERLKLKLESEGLFDTNRKRALPTFPLYVGIVTSPHGAALDDVCNVLNRRFPVTKVILAPTQVQGQKAVVDIIASIDALNKDGRSNVIILTRGGGSFEELWPFNEERVARAIYASGIPIISAVGHERDYTIADQVADVRAATPSAAAEITVPDQLSLRTAVKDRINHLSNNIALRIGHYQYTLESNTHRLGAITPGLVTQSQRLSELKLLINMKAFNRIESNKQQLSGLESRIQNLDPKAILHRGFAIVEKSASQQPREKTKLVTTIATVKHGDNINVTVSDGAFKATVGNKAKRTKPKDHTSDNHPLNLF